MSNNKFDRRGYLKKLSFSKAWNLVKLVLSFHLSRILKRPIIWGMPASLSIEPTTACNLRCPECPSGLRSFTRATGNLKTSTLEKLLKDAKKHLTYLNFYFQGEPFIHPQFLDLVKLASGEGIYTSTSTNAHFLDDKKCQQTIDSGLDSLIISIDGTTQEVYEQYRKEGDLEKVLRGTENIIKWKKLLKSNSPHIVFQFLVVRPNEHQVQDVFKMAEEFGVDEVRLKKAQVYDFKNGNDLIPENEEYQRYRQKKDGTWEVRNSLDNQCWKMWHSSVITWDGKMVPCCFDKDATHQLGDINQSSLGEIWKSNEYQNFRRAILKSRNEIDICQNCSEGTKVWAG